MRPLLLLGALALSGCAALAVGVERPPRQDAVAYPAAAVAFPATEPPPSPPARAPVPRPQ